MYYGSGLVFSSTEGVGSCFHILRGRTLLRQCLVRRVPISCFAHLFSFSAVPRAFGPVFKFCSPASFLAVPTASGPVLMFCGPGHIFGCTDSVRSVIHVMRARSCFRQYRGRRVSFSCFALLDSFSAVPRAFDPVFMCCALELVFGGTEGIGSRFHVLRVRTHFWRCGGRRVSFLCFALPDSFSGVPRASGPIFMFCAPRLILGGTEGVGSRFHVLRSRTHFRRYRGRQVPFSCYARPVSFSAVPMVSGPDLKFSASGLIFGGTEGVWSRFHVLRARTHIRRYGGRRVPF
jgi:hypothetical protein